MANPLDYLNFGAPRSIFSLGQPPVSTIAQGIPGEAAPVAQAQKTREQLIAEAMANNTFAEKRRLYNEQAMASGTPTMMDEAGNIVERALTTVDIMQMTRQASGGNTVSSNPSVLARLMQMAPQQPDKVQLQEEANFKAAQRDMGNPYAAQEVAPGVRAVFGPNGQVVGYSTPPTGQPSTVQIGSQTLPMSEYLTERRVEQAKAGMAPSAFQQGFQSALSAAMAKQAAAAQPSAQAAPVAPVPEPTATPSVQPQAPVQTTAPAMGVATPSFQQLLAESAGEQRRQALAPITPLANEYAKVQAQAQQAAMGKDKAKLPSLVAKMNELRAKMIAEREKAEPGEMAKQQAAYEGRQVGLRAQAMGGPSLGSSNPWERLYR